MEEKFFFQKARSRKKTLNSNADGSLADFGDFVN